MEGCALSMRLAHIFHFNHLPPNIESENEREQKDSQSKLVGLLKTQRLQEDL